MRVGKKPNVVDAKKTRSCVVRLEKVAKRSPNVSPSPEDNRNAIRPTRISTTVMAPTPKQRRGAASQQEEKQISGPIKKRIVGSSSSSNSNLQTPQQKASNAANTPNIRTNQKIKIIPRSNKTTPASTPSRDETPPPTIAAGRSRRAIKPNPKYASEDLVTPKVVRNVATLGSSTSRGGSIASGAAGKNRKASTSSDDFYNRNSEDEYDGNAMENDDDDDDLDMRNDKAYQVNEKDEHDSDFSVIEEQPVRIARPRGRPKRVQEPTQAITPQTNNKLPTQTPTSNVKRTTTATSSANSSNLRSAPSQLQQIRRSLASANAQRNINLLSGSSGVAQKRKLEETQDSSDNESSYTIKRKQLLLSNSSGLKVKVPVRENRVNATSTPFTKSRLGMQKVSTQSQAHNSQHQQTVNGSNKINNSQTASSRRAIEISAKSNADSISKSSQRQSASTAMTNQNMQKTQNQNPLTTQAKILASKANRYRSGSPKLPTQKDRHNNGSAVSISSTSAGSSASLNANSKTSDKTKAVNSHATIKSKTNSTSPHNTAATISSEKSLDIKDDSPNSTMDDFETMPTFTIVNVNDIINKKGDVLITKSKTNNSSKATPTVIEFSESISLDDDDDDEDNVDDVDNDFNDDMEEVEAVVVPPPKKLQKLPTLNNRKELEKKKSPLTRSSESLRKLPTKPATSKGVSASTSSSATNKAPQILNHKLGLRNSRVTPKTTTTLTATLTSPDKPAPRILNSVVAKKTQPVKPMIANMDDSADESFPLSLDEDDEDEEEETEDEIESRTSNLMQMTDKARKREQQQQHHQNLMEVDTEDTESQNTEEDDTVLQNTNNAATFTASNAVALTPKQNTAPQRRRRAPAASHTPIVVSSNKKRMTPAAAKENSLAATNQQVNDTTTGPTKQPIATTLPARKSTTEKVVISKQGDKIIKKITCFETWYVINMPMEIKRPAVMKNQLEMPLIRLANNAKNVCLPNDLWSSKVTLYELSPQTLGKGTFATFTGDLYEHNIKEEDRGKYQPSCVMFRRSIEKNQVSRMPYDRAVIFKNKTFYTNIEGKNVRLMGAPSIINTESEIEILLEVVDGLTLQSDFVEHISIVQ